MQLDWHSGSAWDSRHFQGDCFKLSLADCDMFGLMAAGRSLTKMWIKTNATTATMASGNPHLIPPKYQPIPVITVPVSRANTSLRFTHSPPPKRDCSRQTDCALSLDACHPQISVGYRSGSQVFENVASIAKDVGFNGPANRTITTPMTA